MNGENSNTENRMLRLAEELRSLTLGLCRVGPGSYGFGVHNCALSRLGCMIRLDPDPYGEIPLPNSVSEYRVTVEPISNDGSCGPVNMETVQELAKSGDPATRLVAQALVKLAPTPITISEQEGSDAFDSMVFDMFYDGEKLTAEEAHGLCELRWYESRTPQEIVEFQLFEDQLCMPFEEFQSAVEAVFDRSISLDEFQTNRQTLQEEYQAILAGITAQEEGPEPGVGMTMSGL